MKRHRGFTLIELLVVIAIIGVLASVVLASLNTARVKGRDAARASDIKSLKTALEFYYDDHGGYPTSNGTSNGDVALSDATLQSKLIPQYLPKMPDQLIADGDHYYAGGAISGVSVDYDLKVYVENSNSWCRAGTRPTATGDWGVAAQCNF